MTLDSLLRIALGCRRTGVLAISITVLFALPALGLSNVDPTTLNGKLILGYQGWFACPGDPPGRGWVHWFSGPDPTVDMLPDVAALEASERCPTDLVAADGRPIEVFSSQNPATVARHFAWLREYGLDGVALQRFATQLLRAPLKTAADQVLVNVRRAAEEHGRVFFVMYDLSGMPVDQYALVIADWSGLQEAGLTRGPAYLHHRGHAVLGLWGLGFAGRPLAPSDAQSLLLALAQASEVRGGVSFLGGVPAGWRTGDGDASADPAWQDVWRRLTVISPWTVGRFIDEFGADQYREAKLVPDLVAARAMGIDYMPVVFPGFSWANLKRARHASPEQVVPNQIPRRCGRFYWRQVFNAASSGATMIYGAMFDEVDEGTAMFKLVPTATKAPSGGSFVTLDADGCTLPSDWYLRLAGATADLLNGRIPASAAFPLSLSIRDGP
jgi:hypothetical protein